MLSPFHPNRFVSVGTLLSNLFVLHGSHFFGPVSGSRGGGKHLSIRLCASCRKHFIGSIPSLGDDRVGDLLEGR